MTNRSNDPERSPRPGVFWAFAGEVYLRDGVADSLLDAQDRAGLNVNIALWACWTATIFNAAGDDAMDSAIELVSQWNAGVTKNLRAARRAAKPLEADPEFIGAHDLRLAIKAAELDAERVEIDSLERLAFRLLTPAGGGDTVLRARENLECYAVRAGGPGQDGVALELLHTVLDRIFDASQEKTQSSKERTPS